MIIYTWTKTYSQTLIQSCVLFCKYQTALMAQCMASPMLNTSFMGKLKWANSLFFLPLLGNLPLATNPTVGLALRQYGETKHLLKVGKDGNPLLSAYPCCFSIGESTPPTFRASNHPRFSLRPGACGIPASCWQVHLAFRPWCCCVSGPLVRETCCRSFLLRFFSSGFLACRGIDSFVTLLFHEEGSFLWNLDSHLLCLCRTRFLCGLLRLVLECLVFLNLLCSLCFSWSFGIGWQVCWVTCIPTFLPFLFFWHPYIGWLVPTLHLHLLCWHPWLRLGCFAGSTLPPTSSTSTPSSALTFPIFIPALGTGTHVELAASLKDLRVTLSWQGKLDTIEGHSHICKFNI